MTEKLIESAKASGRWLYVVTYHDGPTTPIEGRLCFKRPEDAQRVAAALLAVDAEATPMPSADCEECQGQGFYSLSDNPDAEHPCEECNGTGKKAEEDERLQRLVEIPRRAAADPAWTVAPIENTPATPEEYLAAVRALRETYEAEMSRLRTAAPSSSSARVMVTGKVTMVELDDAMGPYVMVRCPVSEDRALAIAGLMLKRSEGPVEVTFPDTLFTGVEGAGK